MLTEKSRQGQLPAGNGLGANSNSAHPHSSINRQDGSAQSAIFASGALWYARHGIYVFPCEPGWKNPLTPHGYKDATIDEKQIIEWGRMWPNANIGAPCGANGWVVPDFDTAKPYYAGAELLEMLQEDYTTISQITPSAGVHLIYAARPGVKLTNKRGNLPIGVDVRGDGGYILLAPSICRYTGKDAIERGLPDGYEGQYKWLLKPSDSSPVPIPNFIVDLIMASKDGYRGQDASNRESEPRDDVIAEFNRVNNLVALLEAHGYKIQRQWTGNARMIRPDGSTSSVVVTELAKGWRSYHHNTNDPLYCDDHARDAFDVWTQLEHGGDTKKAFEAAKKAQGKWTEQKKQSKSGQSADGGQDRRDEQAPTDSARDDEGTNDRAKWALLHEGAHDEGNAQCTHARYRGRFCFNDAFGWMQHVGSHWATEGAEAAAERAITETLIARIDAALHSNEADKYGDLIKRCIPSSSRVQGAKMQLRSLVYISPGNFDTDPDLLNCPNGVVDLRTGTIAPHSPGQRFTHCTSVGYDPDADQTAWLDWLTPTVGKETADWLQLAVGYSLTGSTREEILFYLYGPPRAGKGIYSETLLAMLGKPLATEINFGTFTAQRTGDSQNFDLAPLKPCRMVAASESNSYERFNEAKLKALTGGNEIYCAFKHHTHFSYRPQFKIWLSSNEPVNADPDDEAVWGRLRVIEFPLSHLGAEDKTLKQQMRSSEVLKGVLAWGIEGAVKWHALGAAGLPELPLSNTLKRQQREQLDAVGMWLDECCNIPPVVVEGSFTPGSDLYSSYKSWCESNGQAPKQMKGFSQSLKRKGLREDRQWVEGKLKRGFVSVRIL
jgi:P4 family phage/plasmid primase-like protien